MASYRPDAWLINCWCWPLPSGLTVATIQNPCQDLVALLPGLSWGRSGVWVKKLDPHSGGLCSGGLVPGTHACWPWLAEALLAAIPACGQRHCRLWEVFPGPSAGRGRGGRGGGGRKQAGAAAWGGTGASLLGAVIWKPSVGREGGSRLPGATHAGRPRRDPASRLAACLARPGVPAVPCLSLGSTRAGLPPVLVLGSLCTSPAEPQGCSRAAVQLMHPPELWI